MRLSRVLLIISGVLVVLLVLIWLCSYYTSVGIFSLPLDTQVDVWQSKVQWRHTYARVPVFPPQQGPPFPPIFNFPVPQTKTYAGFGFSSGHQTSFARAVENPPGMPVPGKRQIYEVGRSWILLTPMWPLFLLVGWPWIGLVVRNAGQCRGAGSRHRQEETSEERHD